MKYSVKVRTNDNAIINLTTKVEDEKDIEKAIKEKYKTVIEIISFEKKEKFISDKKDKQKEALELESEKLFDQCKAPNRWRAKLLG